MAYVVAKILYMRPMDILLNWGCEELLVTFGFYANAIGRENYDNYNRLPAESKKGQTKPPQYVIAFLTFDQLDELTKEKPEEEMFAKMKENALIEMFQKGGGGIG